MARAVRAYFVAATCRRPALPALTPPRDG